CPCKGKSLGEQAAGVVDIAFCPTESSLRPKRDGDHPGGPARAAESQTVFQEGPRSGEIALEPCQVREADERVARQTVVAQLPADCQSLPQQRLGQAVIALSERHRAEPQQAQKQAVLVLPVPGEGQAFLKHRAGRREITLGTLDQSGDAKRAGQAPAVSRL